MLHTTQTRLTNLLRRLRRAAHAEAHAWAVRSPLRPRTVLYESFAGNGVLDNPEAIFREILRSPDLDDLRHIWVVDDLSDTSAVRAEFARDRRVSFVTYRSAGYFRALATSGYLINNATFPIEFSPRPGQVYLNTWHGTPLKRMGYDMPNGAAESANTLRNFVAADFLLSQNRFMTEQMYERAYKLRGAFQGRIVEEGYPRVDRQYLDHQGFLDARARLENAGVRLDGRNIVLYAPTWKGDSFANPEHDANELLAAVTELQSKLGRSDYVVLLKTHQVVHRFAAERPELRSILVPNDVPTNVVLGLTSVLITDYSSIFFDYLATGRPIVFYTPDSAAYGNDRGTYFALDELPGPVFNELALVADAVSASTSASGDGEMHPNYVKWQARFTSRDDGHAAARVVDTVFRNRLDHDRVMSIAEDSRLPLLLHLGGMRSNGITSSALNLLNSIDHDRFDVSIIIGRPRGSQQVANQAQIHQRVRQFHRMGGMNGHKAHHLRRKLAERYGISNEHHKTRGQAKLWDDEWRRCFGDMRFNAVMDFSGYAPFWATLLLHSPPAIRLIWLHNDMAAEEHRVIRGRRRMRRSLPAVFGLYPQYDRLVSVSGSLTAVNRASLAERFSIDPLAFVQARNQIDATRIRDRMGDDLITSATTIDDDGHSIVPDWARRLASGEDGPWFVSVGRYSIEKNHAGLIRAFASVHSAYPASRLLIIGYGPLRPTLERLITALQVGDAVFLAGPFANPFPAMAAADCFVLSSSYEGQPMVLMEAAIVGLPIVSVAFATIGDALPPGEIHIVQQDDAALAQGMLDYLDGQVVPAALDAEAYNAAALSEFTALITPFSPAERSHSYDSTR
jgi:CDP-glycerol glycerophosphotransferase